MLPLATQSKKVPAAQKAFSLGMLGGNDRKLNYILRNREAKIVQDYLKHSEGQLAKDLRGDI